MRRVVKKILRTIILIGVLSIFLFVLSKQTFTETYVYPLHMNEHGEYYKELTNDYQVLQYQNNTAKLKYYSKKITTLKSDSEPKVEITVEKSKNPLVIEKVKKVVLYIPD